MKTIFAASVTDGQDLQNKVCQMFQEMDMEGQLVNGQAVVDVSAVDRIENPAVKILVACKEWQGPLLKEKLYAFRDAMEDLGADSGFVISASRIQSDVAIIAKSLNIKLLSWEQFQNYFYDRWFEAMVIKASKHAVPVRQYTSPHLIKMTSDADSRKKGDYSWIPPVMKYDIFTLASELLLLPALNSEKGVVTFPMQTFDPANESITPVRMTIEHPREFFYLVFACRDQALLELGQELKRAA